jgi:hypothetical protein
LTIVHPNKRNFIYTIDQLKSLRHERELATPALFRYCTELQLYRRFLAVPPSRRARTITAHTDLPVLIHRIIAI